jgi:hypothetical protein
VSAHEPLKVPHRRLGLRPSDPNRPALKLTRILAAEPPQHPTAVDHFTQVTDWGMYQNDKYGVCGPTTVANSRKLITRALTGVEHSPTQDDVFNLYRASGNPQFDPATGVDDNGVDMATMLSAVRNVGIGGTKSLAEAKVDVTDLNEVRAAIAIFGFLLLGVDLDTAQQDQTDTGVWDYQRSPGWGGHAVLAGAYRCRPIGADVKVITWAEVVGMTDAFWRRQVSEAWIVVWPELIGTEQFQQGIDTAALNADYEALTGRPGPLPAGPSHQDPDTVFARQIHAWLNTRPRTNRQLQDNAAAWLVARGL